MDPFTILYFIGLALAGATAIVVVYLGIQTVRDYLRNKRTEKAIKEAAVIMKKQLDTGSIRVIAGFLDGNDIRDAQVWDAKDVDSNIRSLNDGEVVIVT